ncbi:BTB/POZ and MATH domain-containing protein 3-like [Brachypodium distachyon]|uniref:BTB/POZ and MATH domain-containing protein 3-like n=1 Tax=Brachypodium distachyon TaxID=15368 RepID=UPI00071C7CE0|nr:BTB/POZ and MATH domain-containing protein 3-like [Brachypodium distachyon]|eukprot:XP_014754147.1 BTB/POZ and MATH domain-containing protein 3-like [Brachypodium distachyon]
MDMVLDRGARGGKYQSMQRKMLNQIPDSISVQEDNWFIFAVDDCFTVKVPSKASSLRKENIFVAQALAPKPTPPPAAVVPPAAASLQRHLGDLLSSKEGADVTFMVGDEVFAAHRYILAARSPVLKAQLFGAMKESTGTTKDDAVRVEDMAPQVFEALLYFLYTDCLPSTESETPAPELDVMTQYLLVAADRYDLEKLKLICEERLCECIDASNAR